MTFKTALGVFTKPQILSVLQKMGDSEAKNSWNKTKLAEHLAAFGVAAVCKQMTSAQLKELLEKLGLSASGTKAARSQRLQSHFEGSSDEVKAKGGSTVNIEEIKELILTILKAHRHGIDYRESFEESYDLHVEEGGATAPCPIAFVNSTSSAGSHGYSRTNVVYRHNASNLLFATVMERDGRHTYWHGPFLVEEERITVPMLRFSGDGRTFLMPPIES